LSSDVCIDAADTVSPLVERSDTVSQKVPNNRCPAGCPVIFWYVTTEARPRTCQITTRTSPQWLWQPAPVFFSAP